MQQYKLEGDWLESRFTEKRQIFCLRLQVEHKSAVCSCNSRSKVPAELHWQDTGKVLVRKVIYACSVSTIPYTCVHGHFRRQYSDLVHCGHPHVPKMRHCNDESVNFLHELEKT